MNAAALVIAVGGVAVVYGIAWWFQRHRMSKLRAEREGYSSEQFVDYFARESVRPRVILEVYRYLQQLANLREFPVRPEDSLRQVYGIGRPGGVPLADVIDDLRILCDRAELSPSESDGPALVHTVADLVRMLDQ